MQNLDRKLAEIVEYVPIADAMEFVLVGWVPTPALAGTHHGVYAILMEWRCDCPAPYPPHTAIAVRRRRKSGDGDVVLKRLDLVSVAP